MGAQFRRCIFRIWRDGGPVGARFAGPVDFEPATAWPAIDPAHVVAVDTESLTCDGRLRTVLVPVQLPDGGVLIETPSGRGMMAELLALLCDRFGVKHRASRVWQRKRKSDMRREGRHGRRAKLPRVLVTFYNLAYDLDRLLADRRDLLRAVAMGADAYRVTVGRFDVEVSRMHRGSSSSFDLVARDGKSGKAVRLLGFDCSSYWKEGLGKAAESLGVTRKQEIDPRLYEKPRERFTRAEWETFKRYALGDVQTTREVYLRTVELLCEVDPVVVRRSGVIPVSAPGAATRIVFNGAPGNWSRPPAVFDQLGCDAYFGGRSFSSHPCIARGMISLDIKSAYPAAMAALPDPASSRYTFVRPCEGFDVERWRGRYGVLVVDGESLDDVHPAFRIHDATHNRLRYVVGRFQRMPVTIPELVIGVLSGALRIDKIRRGVLIEGSAEGSFLRKGILRFFALKEDKRNGASLRALAKLIINALYGKLIEVQGGALFVDEAFPMPEFRRREGVVRTIALLYASAGNAADDPEAYWGRDEKSQRKARALYRDMMRERVDSAERRAALAIYAYVEALNAIGEPHSGHTVSVRDYMRQHIKWKCGHYFLPLYAAQVTGITSAKLGLMARCLDAWQGDTDSVHVVCPSGDPDDLPGFDRYFEVMRAAGYPAPREVRGRWVDAIPEAPSLGSWAVEMPPSLESVLVRPKLYSHRYKCAPGCKRHPEGGHTHYKQAQHGLTRFDTPTASRLRRNARMSHEERSARAADELQRGLHQALVRMSRGEPVEYETRPAPRKLKEAIAASREVGEFVTKIVKAGNEPDPNTYRDAAGVVRWLPLDAPAKGAAAE